MQREYANEPFHVASNRWALLMVHPCRKLGVVQQWTLRCFSVALFIVVTWLLAGPWMHFSDTWQLIMNTFSSIVTFVMVFLIQNSQNRDAAAIQLKLNEIMKLLGGRRDLLDVENLSQEELATLREKLMAAGPRDQAKPDGGA